MRTPYKRKQCDVCFTFENIVIANSTNAFCAKHHVPNGNLYRKKVGKGIENPSVEKVHKIPSKFLDPMQEDLK